MINKYKVPNNYPGSHKQVYARQIIGDTREKMHGTLEKVCKNSRFPYTN